MADTTKKIIRGVVNSRGFTITSPITQWDYGWQFIPEIEDLPATYRLDFSNEEKHGTALPVYCGSEGAEVPTELIDTGKDVWVWFVRIGDGFGITEYKWRIPNKCKPKTEQDEPTPTQQSSIDQLITRSNEAVESAEQSAEEADQSARSASADAERAEEARTDAQNYATQAQTSANNASQSASQASASATASAQSASQSAQIKADVEGMVDDAQGYAQASERSASASANSASQAQGFAQSASASANSASGYASQAQTYSQTASAKAQDASQSASTASQKATESAQSASQALTYKNDAEQAKTASQTAQGLAESARDSAISAKNDAEQAKADAESARDEAQQAVASISDALDDKAPVITDTASGAIASFTDGADDLPLKSLVVDINPIQDLHGQDAPYPAGGGTNVLNPENLADGTYITLNSDESVTTQSADGRAWSNVNIVPLKAGTYTVKIFGLTAGYSQVRTSEDNYASNVAFDYNKSATITLTSDGGIKFKIGINATSYPIKAYPIMVNGNTVPAKWSPYENLCPISGWTGVNVQRTGANVWDEEWELGLYDLNTGLPVGSNYSIRGKNRIDVKPSTDYYSTSTYARILFYDSDDSFISFVTGSGVKTTPANCAFMRVYFADTYGTTYNHDISINYPSTDHSYHPYTGRSITIQLGQTVYGGKLDVLTGKLTVYPYYASYNGETLTGEWISDRDKYVSGTAPTIGAQVVNIGAQGVTVQLEPHEVESLYGVNNLWADSGDTTAEYRADTKLFIERLTAPDSADMIADANITSGQYFMVGNSLYKATANIANGSAIVVGTNCTRKSLSEALNEINA